MSDTVPEAAAASRPVVFVLLEDERDLALVPAAVPLGDVVALSCAAAVEGERVDALLQRAASLGAGRQVRVVDPVILGVDYLAIAHVLACAVRHLSESRSDSPVLVLAGDRGRGAVGPAVAERLAVPHLSAVRAARFERDRLLVERVGGADMRRYLGAPPVVLDWALPPGPPSPAASDAQREAKPSVETLSLDTLQITAPELQYRRRFRPQGGAGPRSRPHLVSNVESLGDRLTRDGLWPVPREEADGEAKR
jgi:electron transfer flavoprotein alpha/beta subunit